MRILVVDDSAVSRKLFSVLLKSEGYLVKTVADSTQAQSLLGSFEPDLVLMDVLQPGAKGWEASASMRSRRVVALTSCAAASSIETILDSGCDAVIMKPVNPQTFTALVRMNLQRT